jgi:hypothetical protein
MSTTQRQHEDDEPDIFGRTYFEPRDGLEIDWREILPENEESRRPPRPRGSQAVLKVYSILPDGSKTVTTLEQWMRELRRKDGHK